MLPFQYSVLTGLQIINDYTHVSRLEALAKLDREDNEDKEISYESEKN